jgi:hypothetical protein
VKTKILNSNKEIPSLEFNGNIIHLTFRPSNKDILSLINKCPSIKIIELPECYMSLISSTALEMAGFKGVHIIKWNLS